jgi:hypothetical protein
MRVQYRAGTRGQRIVVLVRNEVRFKVYLLCTLKLTHKG